jgi:hypothetical protein
MEDSTEIINSLRIQLDKLIELNNISLNKIAHENPEFVNEALLSVNKIKKAMVEGDINTINEIRGKYADYNSK